MSRKRLPYFAIVVAFVVAGAAFASSGGSYVLDWFTIDSGGGASTGGTYDLLGSIG